MNEFEPLNTAEYKLNAVSELGWQIIVYDKYNYVHRSISSRLPHYRAFNDMVGKMLDIKYIEPCPNCNTKFKYPERIRLDLRFNDDHKQISGFECPNCDCTAWSDDITDEGALKNWNNGVVEIPELTTETYTPIITQTSNTYYEVNFDDI